MLNRILLIILVVFSSEAFSQKVLQKEFEIQDIEKLTLNVDEVFSVRVTAKNTDKILVITTVQGENYENVVVNTSEENKNLILSTGYSPFFTLENDKLAAHKVISIGMEIIVPRDMELHLSSMLASVIVKGDYKMVYIGLENGSCNLIDFSGNASLQTKSGSITVTAKGNTSGIAISKSGSTLNELPERGKYFIKAESTTGAISLLQTN